MLDGILAVAKEIPGCLDRRCLKGEVHFAIERTTPTRRVNRVYSSIIPVLSCGDATDSFVFVGVDRSGDERRRIPLTVPTEEADVVPRRERAPLALTLVVRMDGLWLQSKDSATSSPVDGCPGFGPTVCLEDRSVDVEKKVQRARALLEQGGEKARKRSNELLAEAKRAYDWRALYEFLITLKRDHSDVRLLRIGAMPEVPFSFVVRAMDVARSKLGQETYENSEQFRRALWNDRSATSGESKPLFDRIVWAKVGR